MGMGRGTKGTLLQCLSSFISMKLQNKQYFLHTITLPIISHDYTINCDIKRT